MPSRTPSSASSPSPSPRPPSSFKEGDLVWARMKGFSWWPSRIIAPKPGVKPPAAAKQKPHLFCIFFGPENFAWVEEERIASYADNREKMKPAKISANLQLAIDRIEDAMKEKKREEEEGEEKRKEEKDEDVEESVSSTTIPAATAAPESSTTASASSTTLSASSTTVSASSSTISASSSSTMPATTSRSLELDNSSATKKSLLLSTSFDLDEDDDDDDKSFTGRLQIIGRKNGIDMEDENEEEESVYFDCDKSPEDGAGFSGGESGAEATSLSTSSKLKSTSPIERSNSLSPLSMLHGADDDGGDKTLSFSRRDENGDEPDAKRARRSPTPILLNRGAGFGKSGFGAVSGSGKESTPPRSGTPTEVIQMQTPVRTFSRKNKSLMSTPVGMGTTPVQTTATAASVQTASLVKSPFVVAVSTSSVETVVSSVDSAKTDVNDEVPINDKAMAEEATKKRETDTLSKSVKNEEKSEEEKNDGWNFESTSAEEWEKATKGKSQKMDEGENELNHEKKNLEKKEIASTDAAVEEKVDAAAATNESTAVTTKASTAAATAVTTTLSTPDNNNSGRPKRERKSVVPKEEAKNEEKKSNSTPKSSANSAAFASSQSATDASDAKEVTNGTSTETEGKPEVKTSRKSEGRSAGKTEAKSGKTEAKSSGKTSSTPKTARSSLKSTPSKTLNGTSSPPSKKDKSSSKSSAKSSVNNSNSSSTLSSSSKAAPSPLRFGFLGLGVMGSSIAHNLVKSGHDLLVWNRSSSKCREVVKAGASKAASPADVVASCDITFCCVSDGAALKAVVFGDGAGGGGRGYGEEVDGVLKGLSDGKGFVDMSTVDAESRNEVAEAIQARGGKFLEAPISGSRGPAQFGRLTILSAGDKELFDECASCFAAIAKKAVYLGDVGNAGKLKTVLNLIDGVAMAGLAEAMALTEQIGLRHEDVLEVIESGSLDCDLIREKGREMLEGVFTPSIALKHQQKDLKLAVNMADEHHLPLITGAAANELFKRARAMGYDEHDNSAVYRAAQYNS